MIVALFVNHAFALDCTSLHQETCDAVNGLRDMVNAEHGSAVIVDAGGPSRFRTTTIYDKLNAVRLAATSGGCRTDDGFDGYTGGVFSYSSGSSFVSGYATENGAWRDVVGDIDYRIRDFTAIDGLTTIGDTFSAYNNEGRLVANRNGGFIAGTWIRTAGANGVFLTLHGACDGVIPPYYAFESWYGEDIGYAPDPIATNLAPAGTASQSSVGSGGVPERAIDGNTDGAYFNGSVTHTENGTNEWWEVDLGAVVTIEDVVIWNRTDCCGERLNNFNVYVSDVPFVSTIPEVTELDPNVTTLFQEDPPANTSVFAFDRTGRYVRVQLTEEAPDDYLQLAEVQVLGYY